MNGLFSTEGSLYRAMSFLADLIILNLLFLLTSLPIITMGASFTALSDVTIKMIQKEEPRAAGEFVSSFKRNFRQATVSWLLILGVSALLMVNLSIVCSADALVLLRIPFLILLVLPAGIGAYVFPMIAVFANSFWKTIRYSAVLAIACLPRTILILLISAIPVCVAASLTKNLIGLFLAIVILFSLTAWINAHLVYKIFRKWVPEKET